MTLPFVTMFVATYNRFPLHGFLLSEVVESFQRQDYPVDCRELLICNDAPGQTLTCDVPGVRILNVSPRFRTLGQKLNFLVESAKGDFLAPCDDDDIVLPHHLSQAVQRLGITDYWNPQRFWFIDQNGIHFEHNHGVCHCASIFTRSLFNRAHGYPAISGSQDAMIDYTLKSMIPMAAPLSDDPAEWSYIYRWFVGNPHHLSAHHPYEASFYERVGMMPIVTGEFKIEPGWQQNYVAQTRAACSEWTAQRLQATMDKASRGES